MLAMHSAICPPAVRRKIVVGGIDQYLDAGPYNFTSPGAQAFVVDQPFAVSAEIQGGQGGNGGNTPGTPGGTGGASNLDGLNQSSGGAGGSSGYYSGRAAVDGPYGIMSPAYYVFTTYYDGTASLSGARWNNTDVWPQVLSGEYFSGAQFNYYHQDGWDSQNNEHHPSVDTYYYTISHNYTAYDVPTWGGTGVAASIVTATVTLNAGSHTANVGAAGTPGSGASATSNGHVKLTAI